MPIPPTATPTGSSQIAPRRSDQSPNSGWITELDTDDASTSTAARVYERSNVLEERQHRRQRAAGEVDGHVPRGERRHRSSVDARPHRLSLTCRRCVSRHSISDSAARRPPSGRNRHGSARKSHGPGTDRSTLSRYRRCRGTAGRRPPPLRWGCGFIPWLFRPGTVRAGIRAGRTSPRERSTDWGSIAAANGDRRRAAAPEGATIIVPLADPPGSPPAGVDGVTNRSRRTRRAPERRPGTPRPARRAPRRRRRARPARRRRARRGPRRRRSGRAQLEATVGGDAAWLLDDSLPLPRRRAGAAPRSRAPCSAATTRARWKTADAANGRGVERLTLVGTRRRRSARPRARPIVAAWTNRARDLANAPPNELTPATLRRARAASSPPSSSTSRRALGPRRDAPSSAWARCSASARAAPTSRA